MRLWIIALILAVLAFCVPANGIKIDVSYATGMENITVPITELPGGYYLFYMDGVLNNGKEFSYNPYQASCYFFEAKAELEREHPDMVCDSFGPWFIKHSSGADVETYYVHLVPAS